MNHQNIAYSAIRRETLTEGTVSDLIRWIEDYTALVFPKSGVEYWSDNMTLDNDYPVKALVESFSGDFQVSCYVVKGHSEGLLIRVGLVQGERFAELGYAKAFTGMDKAWRLAAGVSAALRMVFLDGQQPTLVDTARLLPGMEEWRGAAYRHTVICPLPLLASVKHDAPDAQGPATVEVADANGAGVLSYRFVGDGVDRRINALVEDLKSVSRSLEIPLFFPCSAALAA